MQSVLYRRPPRGRPAIGFQLEAPTAIELRDGAVLHCREVRDDGRVIGELEATVFPAALIIDRDGILAEKAEQVAGASPAVPVRLAGASGYRAEATQGTALPYVYVFAMAPEAEGVDGGVLVTVRSARPEWPAGDHMLRTLRLVTRRGVVANGEPDVPVLPMIALPR